MTTLDPIAAAERFRDATAAASAALDHMDTSLALAEAKLAVVRHHQTHRQAAEYARGDSNPQPAE